MKRKGLMIKLYSVRILGLIAIFEHLFVVLYLLKEAIIGAFKMGRRAAKACMETVCPNYDFVDELVIRINSFSMFVILIYVVIFFLCLLFMMKNKYLLDNPEKLQKTIIIEKALLILLILIPIIFIIFSLM